MEQKMMQVEVYTVLKKNGFEISDNHFLTGEKASYKAISRGD